MAFLIGGANSPDTGYNVTNGVRGVIADRPTLKRDLDTATDADKFTLSFWFKPHTSTTDASLDSRVSQQIWCSLDGSGNAVGYLHFSDASNAQFSFFDAHSGTNPNINWSPLYRDFSAWYHIVLVGDTSQGTDTNRVKFYVNGTQVTATDSATWPDEDGDWSFANASNSHMWFDGTVGKSAWYEVQPCDSSFAELAFVDGSALTPASFGEADEDSGIWKPKSPDVTWGNNGHFMELKESGTGTAGTGTIGADTSGNDNHFTSDSLAAKHMITDTPTNNFCTFNPIFTGQRGTFTEGNTKIVTDVQGSVNYGQSVAGTFLLSSGKWYWEIECDAIGSGGNTGIGAAERIDAGIYSNGHNLLGSTGNSHYNSSGQVQISAETAVTSDVATYTSGDIIGVALDLDNSKIYWSKNGAWQDSGDPAGGSGGQGLTSSYNDNWVPFCSKDDTSNNATFIANFGNPPTTISSGNADDAGYGNFEYDVPAGFYALCTKNLAEYG